LEQVYAITCNFKKEESITSKFIKQIVIRKKYQNSYLFWGVPAITDFLPLKDRPSTDLYRPSTLQRGNYLIAFGPCPIS
jgi:Na+-transporting methylmalonyl-CoA/oxaloacetate decarboxylase beta subunit